MLSFILGVAVGIFTAPFWIYAYQFAKEKYDELKNKN